MLMIQNDKSCGIHHRPISSYATLKCTTKATQSCVGRSVVTHPVKMHISLSTGAEERHVLLLNKLPSICGLCPFVVISSNPPLIH